MHFLPYFIDLQTISLIFILCISREEPMIPEEHEEVNMQDFDPETDRRQRHHMDDDDEHVHAGPGVSCATQ